MRVIACARRRRVTLGVLAAMAASIACSCSGTSGQDTRAAVPASTTTSTAAPSGPTSAPAPTTSVPPAPAPEDLQGPRSVTFVSERTGWILEERACSTPPCSAVVLSTRNGGETWSRLPTEIPPAATPGTTSSSRRIRFADLHNGWIFGPDLLETHDGGAHWSPAALPGGEPADIAALETSAGRVHAVGSQANGIGAVIFTSPVDRDDWHVSPTTLDLGAGPIPVPQIILHRDAGWIVLVNRAVMGGAILRNGNWRPWTPPCADTSGPARLAASSSNDVVAVCDEGTYGGPPPGTHLYISKNGGATFSRQSVAIGHSVGFAGAIATPSAGTVFMVMVDETTSTLAETTDGGRRWQTVYRAAPNTSLSEFGFTSARQGVVIQTTNPSGFNQLWRTTDGGRTWAPLETTNAAP